MGSHFSGIAGFELAGALNGIEVVWATEIEPFPIVVSQAHFPRMKHYGSITDVSGAELEPVDVITFGSPCQDLSVAGKRAGLEGERSGLFMEAVRTIREMRDATSGVYPRIAVWENVPGAMSSNNGADFRAALEEILEAEVPVPRSGKWASAGMVRGNGREIAWRILDAQYWGVPQRRRRIFLICDFRGECAGEILFERQGVSGDSQESGKAGQETTGGTGDGTETAGRYWDGGAVGDCLDCSVLAKQQMMPEKRRFAAVVETVGIPCWDIGDRRRVLESIDVAPTLLSKMGTGGNNVPIVAQLYGMTHAEEVMRPVKPGIAPTLNSRMGTGGNQVPVMLDIVRELMKIHCACGATFIADNLASKCPECGLIQSGEVTYAFTERTRKDGRNFEFQEDMAYALTNPGSGGRAHSRQIMKPEMTVRRLTPLECERLQGFPDVWTEGHSDAARYRMLGNAVCRKVSRWLGERIMKVNEGRR